MAKVTYRRVTHKMGGWKWGYPRGERIAIVRYVEGELKNGMRVWKSTGEVCDGLTAANETGYRKMYPEAFAHGIGSIHNEPLYDRGRVLCDFVDACIQHITCVGGDQDVKSFLSDPDGWRDEIVENWIVDPDRDDEKQYLCKDEWPTVRDEIVSRLREYLEMRELYRDIKSMNMS